ncbi:MAG TPA: hypothetical protein VKR22_14715 [Acidimicrobiales bacterium]|nr:hypothetical protein [Acidimicrobiales bacterium]
MPSRRDQLVGEMATLIETTDEVCAVLQRYRASSVELAERLKRGELLEDIFPAIEGPARPREVTEVIATLEAARRQVRRSMFELGREQGLSIAEVGRQLGISRQRASRLAIEAQPPRA